MEMKPKYSYTPRGRGWRGIHVSRGMFACVVPRKYQRVPNITLLGTGQDCETKFKSMVEENSKVFQGIVTASNLM